MLMNYKQSEGRQKGECWKCIIENIQQVWKSEPRLTALFNAEVITILDSIVYYKKAM